MERWEWREERERGRKGREGRKKDKDETKGPPGSLLMLLFLLLFLLSLFNKPLIGLILPFSASFRSPNCLFFPIVYSKDFHIHIISCSLSPNLFPIYYLSLNRLISLSSSPTSFHLPFLQVCFLHSPYPAANDPGCCSALLFDISQSTNHPKLVPSFSSFHFFTHLFILLIH